MNGLQSGTINSFPIFPAFDLEARRRADELDEQISEARDQANGEALAESVSRQIGVGVCARESFGLALGACAWVRRLLFE